MAEKIKKEAQKFIVRTNRAGVFYGEIKKQDGNTVTMANVRKVWHWDGACAVEELATNGTTRPENCKLTVMVKEMTVMDAIQIIPVTAKAAKSLDGVKEWKREDD